MIAVNRRGFPGSSPFSPEELTAFNNKKGVRIPEALSFMRQRGMEFIGFIHEAVKKLGLPRTREDDSGGITVLGWSLGNIYCLTTLACFNEQDLPESWKETVRNHVSTIHCLHNESDPPIEACGIRPSEEYSSWPEYLFARQQDPDDPGNPTNIARGVKAVNQWVSGWFRYDDNKVGKANREIFIESNDHPMRPSTIESAPDASTLLEAAYPPAYESENSIMLGLTSGVFRTIALYVLDEPSRKTHDGAFLTGSSSEDLITSKKLNWLWCENGPWTCAYNPHLHRDGFGFDGSNPMRKMVAIPNANHFLHWDDPAKFIQNVLPLMS